MGQLTVVWAWSTKPERGMGGKKGVMRSLIRFLPPPLPPPAKWSEVEVPDLDEVAAVCYDPPGPTLLKPRMVTFPALPSEDKKLQQLVGCHIIVSPLPFAECIDDMNAQWRGLEAQAHD